MMTFPTYKFECDIFIWDEQYINFTMPKTLVNTFGLPIALPINPADGGIGAEDLLKGMLEEVSKATGERVCFTNLGNVINNNQHLDNNLF
jgi:hypothetical protein